MTVIIKTNRRTVVRAQQHASENGIHPNSKLAFPRQEQAGECRGPFDYPSSCGVELLLWPVNLPTYVIASHECLDRPVSTLSACDIQGICAKMSAESTRTSERQQSSDLIMSKIYIQNS